MMTVYALAILVTTLLVLVFFRNRKRLGKITVESSRAGSTAGLTEDNLTQSNGSRLDSWNNRSSGVSKYSTLLEKQAPPPLTFKQQLKAVIRDVCFVCLMAGTFFCIGTITGFSDNFVGMVSAFGIPEVSHFLKIVHQDLTSFDFSKRVKINSFYLFFGFLTFD